MHRDGISAVILDYTTSSPRPLHLLQVDKQVVAVNSSDINIELLQQYETTDGRQGAPLQPPQHQASGGDEAPPNWALQEYARVLPSEGNTNVSQQEDFASHF